MSDTFQPGDLSPSLDGNVVVGSYRAAATVTAKRPLPGESITFGDVYPITWSTSARVRFQSFTIELSTNGGGAWVTLAEGLHADDRVHEWEVAGSASANCILRITGNRIAGGVSAVSGTFTIAA